MTQEQTKTPMTDKELFKKLVDIHTEINAHKELIKAIKDDLKEDGSELDFGSINKVAVKAASFKVEEAKAQAAEFIDMIEQLT
jgi:hypothetical protein